MIKKWQMLNIFLAGVMVTGIAYGQDNSSVIDGFETEKCTGDVKKTSTICPVQFNIAHVIKASKEARALKLQVGTNKGVPFLFMPEKEEKLMALLEQNIKGVGQMKASDIKAILNDEHKTNDGRIICRYRMKLPKPMSRSIAKTQGKKKSSVQGVCFSLSHSKEFYDIERNRPRAHGMSIPNP